MSEGTVGEWCRMFRDARTFVKYGTSQFQNFRVNFHKFRALICTRLSQLPQVLRKMCSENAHGCAQNAENGFGFEYFLERYDKDGDESLNHTE
jgi:hypothetical protein